MRIVIATPFYPPEAGVLGTYAAEMERAFKKQGHTVSVVSFGTVRHLPPIVRHFLYFLALRRAAQGADFVLALDTWSVGMPAMFAAKHRGVPLLVRVGGDFLWETYIERTKEPVRLSDFYEVARKLSLKERLILKGMRRLTLGAHTLLFNARFLRDIWQKTYGFPHEKARIAENFYPAKRISEPALNRVFVSAGRRIALKNYAGLERAFAQVKEKYPKVELDTRTLSPTEHAERVAKSYAIVIPSLSEVSSNTAIDAVAAGKPFIMTDDTGTKERLSDCGIFVDIRSEAALVKAIETLLNPENYEYCTARIREFSFEHSWDEIAREVIAALRRQ